MNTSTRYCAHCGAANSDDETLCFACGQPLSEAESLSADLLTKPLLKGRYHLLARLGAGGFGAVYRAEDTSLGNRMVAIKEMAQSGLKPAELAEATEAFQREAYLLAGLKHPNLPHIYDHFREAGRWYLVMDFIEGQTLETLLEQTPAHRLPVNDVLKIGLQLANVLDYLHTNQPPIIFRDLKPANVMLTASGQVYLIDFGIARLFKPGQVKDTSIIGTPGYLAPEGYGKAQTTPRSDIYSLGATLHHLLSGIDPSERPFFFAPLQPPVPAPLQALVAQMVKMEEQNRPASMADVTARLQQIEDGSALAAPTAVLTAPGPAETRPAAPEQGNGPSQPLRIIPVAGQLYLPTPLPAQNKGAITRRNVTIGLGAVLAGGAIWALARTSAHQPQVSAAPTMQPTPSGTSFSTPVPPATPTPPNITPIATETTIYQTYKGHTDSIVALAWSPLDGTTIASASNDNTTQVWDSATLRRFYTRQEEMFRMAWSPDGQYIATGGPAGQVQVWLAGTGGNVLTYPRQAAFNRRSLLFSGQSTLIKNQMARWKPGGKYAPFSGGGVNALAWSPDSQRIASSGYTYSIQVWEALTGNLLNVFGDPASGTFALAWKTDGVRILSGSSSPTNDVYLWDTTTGNMLAPYQEHRGAVIALASSPDGHFFASGSQDNTVCVWDENQDIPITVYTGHSAEINAIAWSPDGNRIASASDDGTVQIWDAKNGGNRFIFHGHTAAVRAVAWSPQKNRIASGGDDAIVQIWQPI
jgi:WD40 repeat protein/tRNA A-37 threonylcarbamoyl transferase component Bud32